MGITETVWARMQEPKSGMSDDFARTTQLYLDTYVALELLHMPYSAYIATVPRQERLLHQLYVMLKNAKEEHAMEQAELEAEAVHEAESPMSGRF